MILVTTPNGKVGREVAAQLLAQDQEIRLAAHTPEKAKKAFSGTSNVDIVPFDFTDEETITAALAGVDALYLASPGEGDVDAVRRVVDLAKEAGVERVVRLSAMGVERSDNPLRQVEQYIEASGLTWTHLRPNWFMQNFSTTSAEGVREHGVIAEPAGEAKTSFIDTRDIAAMAVKALTEEGHHEQAYSLTGEHAYDRYEVAEVLSEATGKEVHYEALSEETFQERMSGAGMPGEYLELMTNLYQAVRAGYTAETTDTFARVTGRAPTSLKQFAQDHKEVWQ